MMVLKICVLSALTNSYFYVTNMEDFKPTTYEEMIKYINEHDVKILNTTNKKDLIKNYEIPLYYYKLLIDRKFDDKFIFIVFPWLFDILSISMSYDEYEKFKKDMLKFIEDNYSSMEIKGIKNVASLYEITSQNVSIDKSKLSSLAYFKYLIGATFPCVSIDHKTLESLNTENANIFRINATYNLQYPNSIVKYRDVDIKYRILNPKTIDDYNSSIQYRPPLSIAKEMYKIEDNGSNKYIIVIDYNNKYYTVVKFKDSIYVSQKFVDNLLLGKLDIPEIIDDIINTRIKYEFYNKTKTIPNKSRDELKRKYLSLQSLAFNTPITDIHTYASELSKTALKEGMIEPEDEPYFQKYLECMNVEFSDTNKNNVVNYVLSYIYPDLLVVVK